MICVAVGLMPSAARQARRTKIFGGDPSGGLWGATVNETGAGLAERLNNVIAKGFDEKVISVSYDHHSKRVLLETDNPHALYYAPLCSKKSDLPELIIHVESAPLFDPRMGDCVNCKTSAFVLHNSRIYFLLTGEFFSSNGNIHRIAQIRYFQPCSECDSQKPLEQYQYVDTVHCSHKVTDVFHDIFDAYTLDDIELKGGKNMALHENEDGSFDFFFHFGKITHSDSEDDKVWLSLWHASSDGSSRALADDVMLPDRYADWAMTGLGSVSYKVSTGIISTGFAFINT